MPGRPGVDTRLFVLALLSDVAGDRRCGSRFKSGHQDIHVFFWGLSREPETEPLVGGLLFDTNGTYPYSLEIDELLQEFQLSGLLARPNPTYRYNDIKFSTPEYSVELKKALSTEQKNAYDQVVERFKQKLCVPANG